jgi:hypothetical protein
MEIVRIDPQTNPLWQQLVERSQSSVFHSPAWMRVLAETYGFEVGAYVTLDEAREPRAGIPFCRITDMMGKRIVILPFSDYFDALVSDMDQWHCLAERLLEEGCPVVVRCLHNDLPLVDERFTLVNRAKWHGLDLQPDLDTLWRGLRSSARRAIKKAKRDGVVVRIAKLSNIQEHLDNGRIEFIQTDLREPGVAQRSVEGVDVVFHLAADHGGRGYVDLHQAACATNLVLDGIVFLACRKAGVERIVYASSGCVYPNFCNSQ